MNIIATGLENAAVEVDELRRRGCSVEVLPGERLIEILKADAAPFLCVDAIACFVDVGEAELSSPPTLALEVTEAETLVREIRRLPEDRAMLDGRKWKSLPIIVVLSGSVVTFAKERIGRLATTEHIAFLEAIQDFKSTFRCIATAVREYRRALLDEFSDGGYVVTYDHGRYRVSTACTALGNLEGFYYDARRDKRRLHGSYFTIDRDSTGTYFELDQFEALITNSQTTENQLQQFFEDNPHFLVDSRMSVPLPHVRLETEVGEVLVPDFVIRPIVAYERDSRWQVLDLKKPNAKLLAKEGRHTRFSHEVIKAIAQLRDYGDYFKNPEHTDTVNKILGHALKHPKLAVLIGRLQGYSVEELEKHQARQPDVDIVTYDEILQRQQHVVQYL